MFTLFDVTHISKNRSDKLKEHIGEYKVLPIACEDAGRVQYSPPSSCDRNTRVQSAIVLDVGSHDDRHDIAIISRSRRGKNLHFQSCLALDATS